MTDKQGRRWSIERVLVVGAIAAGLAAGTYGIASAANGSSSSQSSTASSLGLPSIDAAASSSNNDQHPWGRQRSDETLLSGDAAARVRQLALARVSGGTISSASRPMQTATRPTKPTWSRPTGRR